MYISYKSGIVPDVDHVIELFIKTQMPRPINDRDRTRKMLENADLIWTAWDGQKLVGVCRCITDWVWCCYLSDLAVDPAYKKNGIGKKLIQLTKDSIGEQVMILLLSVPAAMDYYPRAGFTKEDRGFIINRKK